MIPIRIVETERDDFDGPVVELWRDEEFVGQVFWDGEVAVAQIYPDGDGDVHDLDVTDLLRALDTAHSIVDPSAFAEEMAELRMAASMVSLGDAPTEDADDGAWDDEHPATLELTTEFDPSAAHRSDDGEGFFPVDVAEELVRRCEELGLAVIEMDGFDAETMRPAPGMELVVERPRIMSWRDFRSYANTTALSTLADWRSESDPVVAFVIEQPDGETVVV